MTLKTLSVGLCFWLVAGTAMSMTPGNIQDRAQFVNENNFSQQSQPSLDNFPQSIPEAIPAAQFPPSTEPSKIIIRPASTLTTPKPFKTHRMPENTDNGCKCESLDACPIELMDFSFSVSCGYGTVRCCRPIEPATEPPIEAPFEAPVEVPSENPIKSSVEPSTTEESFVTKPVVVTPTTVKFSKKPLACKCKPRKECDRFFQTEEEVEVFDRKDVLTCPAGMVRCCETGNMGNHKEATTPKTFKKIQATQILGNTGFKPVQLPFLTVPVISNQRISEQELQPTDQELESLDVTSSTATLSLSETEASTEKPVKINRPQIFFPQPVLVPFQQQHQQQQPTLSQQFHQQPAFQQQPNMLHIRPISPPVIEAGFQPIIRGQGASNQPSPVRPGQVFGLRPAPPQQGPTGPIQSIKPIPQKNQQQNTTTTTPRPTRRTMRPQFGLSVPTPPPSPSPPPAPHIQMRPPMATLPFQPIQRPPPPPQRSSGFFSSLMSMFN